MRFLLFVLLLAITPAFAQPTKGPQPRTVEFAIAESSLATSGIHIRQFAFDADPASYFASEKNASKTDHFTLTFDHPVVLQTLLVQTGRPNGDDSLSEGVLEASGDGKSFEMFAKFEKGQASLKPSREIRIIKAIRIRPTEDLKYPLVIREITIDSNPRVIPFRYPIEFALDVSDAPEMKEWGEKVVRICERQYPIICDELMSDGFKPLTQIRMTMKKDYKGVAEASGGRITGSVKFFKDHPEDIGAMIHETVHCVQGYRARGLPGWLVEGIADHVRFWRYEPGKAGPLNPARAKYDASYRTTAAFLAYVTDKYEEKAVTKLNALLRENKYDAGVWKTLTGKSVEELNKEWRESLAK